jgi:hypothetical protein
MLVWGDKFECRNDTLDREGNYMAREDNCYHKSTQVKMEDGRLKTLEELQVGDKLLLREDMPSEPVMVKIWHEEKSIVEVLKIKYVNHEMSEVAEMILTPDHYLYEKSSVELVLARQTKIGDQFISLSGYTLEIISVESFLVPSSDLVQIYTPSNTFSLGAYSILASCKSRFDLSDVHVPLSHFIFKHISESLP